MTTAEYNPKSVSWKLGQRVAWTTGPHHLRREGVVMRVFEDGLECRTALKTNPVRRVLWSCKPRTVEPRSVLGQVEDKENS